MARFGERLMILLARGDAIVEAKAGETLDGLYEVRSANPEGVALIYAPLGIEQLVAAALVPDPAGPFVAAAPQQSAPGVSSGSSQPPADAAPAPQGFPPGSPLAPR
jgi:hypothetical protein